MGIDYIPLYDRVILNLEEPPKFDWRSSCIQAAPIDDERVEQLENRVKELEKRVRDLDWLKKVLEAGE